MAVKAVACELPRTLELPLSRLFVPDIQKEVIRQGIVARSPDRFDRLVDQVMSTEPYASARCVYWIVDNGSSQRGQASIKRLEGAT